MDNMEVDAVVKFAEKVNVLGTTYTIEMMAKAEDKLFRDGKCDGWCDNTSKRIAVCRETGTDLDNADTYMRHVLRHELVHAMLYESGIGCSYVHPQYGHDETMVDWMAAQGPKLHAIWQAAGAL